MRKLANILFFLVKKLNFEQCKHFSKSLEILLAYQKKILLALVLFHAAFSSIHAENYQKAMFHIKNAESFTNMENFPQALRELEAAETEFTRDGHVATRIGILVAYRMKDLPASLSHFERALRQGGDKIPWTLREYGFALLRTGNEDTAEEFLNQSLDLSSGNLKEMEISYGYVSHLYRKKRKFMDSIRFALEGYTINPKSDDFYLCDSIVISSLFLAYEALIHKDYDASIQYISQSEKYLSKNTIVREQSKKYEIHIQRQIIQNRKKIGIIKPVYRNKILSFFISDTDVNFISLKGENIRGLSKISQEEEDLAIFYQGVLREFIESMSGGNYSISFENIKLKGTLRDIRVSSYGGLDTREPVFETTSPPLSELFFRYRNQYDTFAIYWNGKDISTTANGGGFSYPYVNYQMYGSNRGYISFPTNWSDEIQIIGLVHEFFHNIESLTGIGPPHGYLSRELFPEWKGEGELDYYRWHFANTLPRVLNDRLLREQASNWKNLGWLERFPDSFTEEDYQNNLKLSSRISSANLKKSYELAMKAKVYYWEKGDISSADPLFKEAFRLNPYNPFALRYMGDLENKNGNYPKAFSHFSTLLQITPEPWVFRSVIYLQQWNLKDFIGAQETYKKYFSRYPKEKSDHLVEYGRLQIELGNYEEALKNFEQGIQSGDSSRKPSVRSQCNFWKGFVLGEKKGDTKQALKFIKLGVEDGYKDSVTLFYLKKYSKLPQD